MYDVEIMVKNYRCFSDSNPLRFILRDGITGLIGVNNSGKSSLLKIFYELRGIFSYFNSDAAILGAFRSGKINFSFPQEVFEPQEVFYNRNDRPLELELNLESWPATVAPVGKVKILFVVARETQFTAHIYLDGRELIKPSLKIVNGLITHDNTAFLKFENLANLFSDLTKCLYIGPFRNTFNTFFHVKSNSIGERNTIQNLHAQYYDLRIGVSLIRHWRESKTGSNKKTSLLTYDVVERLKGIFGFSKLEINSDSEDRTIQVFVDGNVYALHELGAGISQFFLVLANIAIARPSWVLIDEPELNLHPSLQLDFLTTLTKYATRGAIFGTHSIGLARAGADWIYTVHKGIEASTLLPYEQSPLLTELLGELSFSTYREFGFNKILLVEGKTEIKTIQQFLRKYHKDHEILLLPLGGSAMISASSEHELREIQRISTRIYVLIDSEKTSAQAPLDASRIEFLDTCSKLAINYHVLELRATENYFPERAIKSALGSSYNALAPYAKLSKNNGWSKSDNWRIASEMTISELEATDLGKYILRVCDLVTT